MIKKLTKEGVMAPTPTPYKDNRFEKDHVTPVHDTKNGTWLLSFDINNKPFLGAPAQRRTEVGSTEQKLLAQNMKKSYNGIESVYALPEEKYTSDLCQMTDEDFFEYVKKNGKLIDTKTEVKESIAPKETVRLARDLAVDFEDFLAQISRTGNDFFDDEDLQAFSITLDALNEFTQFQD